MGKTNAEAWDAVISYSRILSEHAQKLGFAGIALCWFFRSREGDFPALILFALIVFVVFFVLDVTQYWYGAVRYRGWIRGREAANRAAGNDFDAGDFAFPDEFDEPAWTLFNVKLAVLFAAFVLVGIELVRQM